ncbi:hypothetical protein [Nonlabens ponticola]|uniref:Uncharacterized protein n=1 Tax=Nonlabens ponticola TaxID=2496866 RepID=A0A3S9N118_9FLAO|nr:hypothetical protein [Nonlabens ponticola]AZQ45013.1 hypothetical protein EJ995_12525 [Nonlabens ponticola]
MKKYLILGALAITSLIGCDKDDELRVFDAEGGQTLIGFVNESEDLRIVENGTGTLRIPVNVSTVSDQDRTFNISLNDDSDALEDSYDLPDTFTVPAGEYTGFIEINGVDEDVEVDPRGIIIDLVGNGDDVIVEDDNSQVVVRVFQVCPVPEDYLVGSYSFENGITVTGPTFGDQNFDEGDVEITIGPAETQRTFTRQLLPANGGNVQSVVIDLGCESALRFGTTLATGFTNLIYVPNPNSTATYDLDDDEEFTVDYIENPNNAFAPTSGVATFEIEKNDD